MDETPLKVQPAIEDITVKATKVPTDELQIVQPPVKYVPPEEQILSDEVPHNLQSVANAKIVAPQSAELITQEIIPEPIQPVVESPSQNEGVVEGALSISSITIVLTDGIASSSCCRSTTSPICRSRDSRSLC
jgi:hypothetical protein